MKPGGRQSGSGAQKRGVASGPAPIVKEEPDDYAEDVEDEDDGEEVSINTKNTIPCNFYLAFLLPFQFFYISNFLHTIQNALIMAVQNSSKKLKMFRIIEPIMWKS